MKENQSVFIYRLVTIIQSGHVQQKYVSVQMKIQIYKAHCIGTQYLLDVEAFHLNIVTGLKLSAYVRHLSAVRDLRCVNTGLKPSVYVRHLSAVRDLRCVTPVLTRRLGVSGLNRRTAQIKSPDTTSKEDRGFN